MVFRKLVSLFLIVFSFSSVFAQISQTDGIYENNNKIISLTTNSDETIDANLVLKTFYGFYYDGQYADSEKNAVNIAIIGNNVYTEYWTASVAYASMGKDPEIEEPAKPIFLTTVKKLPKFHLATAEIADGTLWLPATNTNEITLDTSIYKNELVGYYVDKSGIYPIRYWICDVPYSKEKAELSLLSAESESVYIDKYVKIQDRVYTCATGLRSKIRNVVKIDNFEQSEVKSADNTILVFGEPYLVLSDIENIDNEIREHNSIRYPPKDGRAKFVEPTIYKKLDAMTIDEL